jgi:tetratricopeptide (TPR) repeat protein
MMSFSIRILLAALVLTGSTNVSNAQDTAAAQAPPRDAVADQMYYDAVKARMLGDDDKSETLLKQVIAARPDSAAPYYDLSRLSFKVANVGKSEEYIRKAISIDGKNKWYREQLANVLVLKNDFAGAAGEYATMAQAEGINDEYLEKSARLYQRAAKYPEALAQIKKLKEKGADNEDAMRLELQTYLKMNDVDAAAKVVRQLITQNPKELEFYKLLMEVYQSNKQPEKAKEVLAEMQKKFPADPSLQLTLAAEALKKGDTAQFREFVRKASVNKELDAKNQLGLLTTYLSVINHDSTQRMEALQLIRQISAQHPENVDVLLAYARILNFNGMRKEASEQYRKALAIDPNDYEAWEQMLVSMTAPDDADSLIRWTERAMKLYPNQAMVHYLNGVGYYNKKEYKQAVRSINRAIDMAPEEKNEEISDMFGLLGDIHQAMKEYSQSDSSYEQALKQNPLNATVLNNYAYYLSLRNKRLDDAARMSKQSLKVRPEEPTFLDTYGWILYQQGKYKDALDFLRRAVMANPETADATVWEHYGAAQFRTGDKEGAVASWKRAKDRGTENTNIDKMISEQKLYE